MNKFLTCLLVVNCSLAAAASNQATTPDSDDSITIYSRMQPGAVPPEWYRPSGGVQSGSNVPGYAIVRHDRAYDIDQGVTALRITDVAALIDPTTVTFSSLDKPDTRVMEQSFQFDLVSQEKL
jgi:hypothetical protein